MCIKSSLVFFSWVRIHLYSPKSLLRSKVENTLVLAKKSGASASKGIGKLPTLVTLLTLRKSIQNLCDPSFLFTIATGELQGETDSSYSFLTNFVHPTVDLWEITVHILNSSPPICLISSWISGVLNEKNDNVNILVWHTFYIISSM